MNFQEFFKTATGHPPYLWQCRLACGEPPDGANCDLDHPDELTKNWLTSRNPCFSRLIDIPTGLGKTAGVVLAWLWNYVVVGCQDWPRRLVYCLPMRTLVEQTVGEIEKWLKALAKEYPDNADLKWLAGVALDASPLHNSSSIIHPSPHSPITLMGGEELDGNRKDWHLHPERPAILIGTQDMLLSRALNRGYAASRARWPQDFALLNNDCLWVMDEVQLMGAGLWTSSQLDWLRQDRFKPAKDCMTWWMSATIDPAFLNTKDRQDAHHLLAPTKIKITDGEADELDILKAIRPVTHWQPAKPKDCKDRSSYIKSLAHAISDEHKEHTLSLIVCNTVAVAQEVFSALRDAKNDAEIILLTSRFRPVDRKAHLEKLLAFEDARKAAIKNGSTETEFRGLICVATQVIEAGADISACRLWTELAPWSSTLQRLGRLNRDGKYDSMDRSGNHVSTSACAFVFEFPADKNPASPYEPGDLKTGKKIIEALFEAYKHPSATAKPIRNILLELAVPNSRIHDDIAESLEPKPTPFPSAFEIHGLFSTEPDVFGGFTDVSNWVRGGEKNADVIIFWRDWDSAKKSPNAAEYVGPAFQRNEACPVAVYRVREFVKNSKTAFVWNDRTEQWNAIKHDDICPGMVVMLPASSGGYDAGKGWTGTKTDKPANTPTPGPFNGEGDDDKQTTVKKQWVELNQHLNAVAAEATSIAEMLTLPPEHKTALVRAAALHDIGKSFPQWQDALPLSRPDVTSLWAKAPSFDKRAGMRHEVASALAAWHRYYRDLNADFPALTIYLIAAHHGLVRTVLTSRPTPAKQPNVAGIPVVEPPPVLPWHETTGDHWRLDFTPAEDGGDGAFSENENGEPVYVPTSPGWTALVADLLGGWEASAHQPSSGAVHANEPHSLNPFHLAFLETLLRAADCRVSASETGIPTTEVTKQ